MTPKTAPTKSRLKMAVIGGGRRCQSLLEVLKSKKITRLKTEIAGVADINPHATGLQYAKKQGIFTTHDYRDLFHIPGLELLINLTGDKNLSDELTNNKPKSLPVLNHTASRLFQEIVKGALTSTQVIREKEEELSLSHSFIQTMAEVTVVGVLLLDTNHKIIWINETLLKNTGLTKKEAIGKYCFQISHNAIAPCNDPDSACPMKETLQTGKSSHAIHEHILQEKTYYCDVSTYPILNSKGQTVQILEVIRDITQELNDKLERRTKSIKRDLARLVREDKMISLGKMVASVAHEINNPISAIINFNKLILKTITEGRPTDQDLTDFQRYLELIIREAQRCGMIVGNLLSFARQQPMEAKRIDLKEMFTRIMLLTQHRMTISNIIVTLNLDSAPLEVWGDYTQIQQCFTNFVFNAIEAMPKGGALLIRGRAPSDQEKVWVEVTDTGVGIPKDNMDKIFEPFFTTKAEVSGVGLGLSMVYGIIKEHRGSIHVTSEVDKGTTFHITLPKNPG